MSQLKKGQRTKKGFKRVVHLPNNFIDQVESQIEDEMITRTNNETMRPSY